MSTQTSTTTTPSPFPWETPGPISPFWSSFPDKYNHIGRQFLSVFGPETLASMPLDASLSQPDKIAQLLSLAQSALSSDPVYTHPTPETLHRFPWTVWRNMISLIAVLETKTGLTTEPVEKYRRLVDAWDKRFAAGTDDQMRCPRDVGGLNSLAHLYVSKGMYSQAEEIVVQLPGWYKLHPMTGPGPSPHEMGARRMEIEILAKTGRLDEAKQKVAEGYEVIQEMETAEGGKFVKYVQEEIEALDEVKSKLDEWSRDE